MTFKKNNVPVLDLCCGSKMFYLDKNNPSVFFMDIRQEPLQKLSNGAYFEIKPDLIADFTSVPFSDETFSMVIFDPPHTFCGQKSFLFKKYGTLKRRTYKDVISSGFKEAFRVLKPNGTLIFKWSDCNIALNDVLQLTNIRPLIKHSSFSQSKKAKTYFMVFIKNFKTKK